MYLYKNSFVINKLKKLKILKVEECSDIARLEELPRQLESLKINQISNMDLKLLRRKFPDVRINEITYGKLN